MRGIILILAFLITSVTVRISYASANDGVSMSLDFARFRYDQNNTYLEIYYLVNYESKDSLNDSKNMWLEFVLTDIQKDSVVASSSQEVTLQSSRSGDDGSPSVKGSLVKAVLPTGQYSLQMIRLDENKNQKLDSIQYEFKAPEFRKDKIAVSDLELGSRIITRSNNKEGVFYKNTMEVFPNPTHVFGKDNPMLFYYIELYNLQNKQVPGDLEVQAVVSDHAGQIRLEKSYKRKRGHESTVEYGQFNITKLESGLYTLIFAVVDSTSDYSVYTRSNFYINNPDVMLVSDEGHEETFSESEFSDLPEYELNERFKSVTYIASKNEMDVYKRLDTPESKRKFLYEFWRDEQRRDLKDKYYQRVDMANELYAYSNREGWQSDRGRIYVVYGEPDRILKKPHNPDDIPYEVWYYYDLEGGVKFLFGDETGFGEYILMNSTKRGEIHDPKYDEILRREE
jgi:GWxTD domain-containing protein